MFSELVNSIEEAGSIRINQMVYEKRQKKEDVVVLSLGEAFFKIPAFDFTEIEFEAGYHYSDSRGLPALRKKLSEHYQKQFGVESDPDKNVLISAGSKIVIYMAMLAVLNDGDEVLVHEPYWLSYPEQAKLCRGVPKVIPYATKPADFSKYIHGKTKLVILNNPNNPAGYVYTLQDLRIIHEECKKVGAYLLVDEAYGDFVVDDSFKSAGLLDKGFDHLIIVNSLSKSQGMSGWRLGYAITGEALLKKLLKLNQHLITCAPTILMQYVAHYFEQIMGHTLPQAREVVEKRKRISNVMNELGLKRMPGETTFYFMLDISGSGRGSQQFAEDLLREHSIAVVPGNCYGPGLDKYVRVGVGTESEQRIVKALHVIRDECRGS